MSDIPALSMLKDKIWKIKFLPRFEEQQDFREYIQYCGEMLSNAIMVLGEVRNYINRIEERIAELAKFIRDASGSVHTDLKLVLNQVKDIRMMVENTQASAPSTGKSLLPSIEITDSVVGSYSRQKEHEMQRQRTMETLDKEANLVETLMGNIEAITSANGKAVQVNDITDVLIELESLLLDTNYIEYQTKAIEDFANRGGVKDITDAHMDMLDVANMISFSDLDIEKLNKVRDDRMTKISEETEDDFDSERDSKQKSARTPRSKSKSSHRKHSSKSNASKRKPEREAELPELDLLELDRGDEASDIDTDVSLILNENDHIVLDESASYRAKQALFFEEKKIKREQERRRLRKEMRRQNSGRGNNLDDDYDKDLEEMHRRLEAESTRLENSRKQTEELRNKREHEFKQLEALEAEKKLMEQKKKQEQEEMEKQQALQKELGEKQKREREESESKRKQEAKRREDEQRRRKEEDERLKRQNSKTWDNFVYRRPPPRDNEETETYHRGVCCVIAAVATRLTKTDVDCVPCDDVDVINTCLDDADKLASSVLTVTSNVGTVHLEAPVRVYIPHIDIPEDSYDLLLKVSLNGGDWTYQKPVRPAKKAPQGIHFVGAALDNFDSAKLVVVIRHKADVAMVTKEEVCLTSAFNRYVKIDIQKDTFPTETSVRFESHKISENVIAQCKDLDETCKCIMSCRTMVTVWSGTTPTKPLRVRFSEPLHEPKQNVEVAFKMYKAETDQWAIDRGPKSQTDSVVVELPAKYRYYSATEVTVLQSTPEEDIVNAMDCLYNCIHGDVVKLIVKQRNDNFSRAIIHCIKEHVAASREALLADIGFNAGPPTSQKFCIQEGEELCLSCNGNVAFASPPLDTIRLPFFRFFDRTSVQVELKVADSFLQKTLPEYIGHIQAYIQGRRFDTLSQPMRDLERKVAMCIVLPKIKPAVKKKVEPTVIPSGLPNYVVAFARFVSLRLLEEVGSDEICLKVLAELEGKKKLKSMVRKARLKVGEDSGEVAVSTTIITDWMKTKPKYSDKLTPILIALEKQKLPELKNECKQFLKVYKGMMSDSALHTIADYLHEDNDTIGRRLGLSNNDLDLLLYNASGTRKFKAVTLLMKWRDSDEGIQNGVAIFDKLMELLALDEETAHKIKEALTASSSSAF